MWAIPTKKEKIINELNIVKGLNPGVIVVDSDWPFDNLGGSHLQSQSELYHVSWWYYTLVIDLTIYRKPTHTDRLLDQSSYNPTSHKATTIRTLTRRAQLVCDSPDSLQDETDYLNNVFSKTCFF